MIIRLILIGLMLGLTACSSSSTKINVGSDAPFTRFALMDGNFVTTENYKGKYMLVVFWATTCPKSKGVFEDLAEWLKEDRPRGLKVLSVSIDKSSKQDQVAKFLENPDLKGIQHAYSGNDIYDEAYIAYDVGELPFLILVDPEGKIAAGGTSLDDVTEVFTQGQ